ncbi:MULTISPECIES: alpha/beta hydrolase [Plesiomonas]|uniref:Alpha/beta hydrolase n=1 Tax=Plesiomonas shigelloides TaxID=703 RepID=A0A1A9AXT3_PLESH|nr:MULTISPECIES: alpha/beta hydrolase [Plesiomonas]AVQ86321.1 alpha/beta hydrolase [Plesiomonas shigelloides]KAB7662127.1 alpha/beta hydrolase fold domain-containing protein [Plesiomonas shigelloides]KAB7670999.1 alpha/beta hydrolase fold domain-containing protein [Plesiomonas shigelloides]KAB7674063.1 alpha/beta hydrolase fold domain-containing protein [Plesiomonas shigelloides]KAB7674678.1 alpha/beta hydrolase fold domain-containing protein [Plesiomonas shigelloides]
MPSWSSKALNKLLAQAMRARLQRCDNVAELRAVISGLDNMSHYVSSPASLEAIPDTINGVPCDWITTGQPVGQTVLLFFHGGGFCLKASALHFSLLGKLAEVCHARGIMVDYRLSPEFPYPAAVEDCFQVYRGLLEQGILPSQIILAGDSAGGNLVLTTLLQIREHNMAQPACGILFSPATDMALNSPSAFFMRNEDPFFDLGSLLLMRNSYLQGKLPCEPLISPVYADLHQLAPMMIHVGSLEILMDDSVRVAARVREQRGVVDLTVWPGMPHVFPLFQLLPESQEAMNRCAAFAAAHLQRASAEHARAADKER